jgi:lysozyme family protein
MADFQPAVTITLQNEGGFLHNPVTGEIANHGVTLKFVRSSGYKCDADETFIRSLSRTEALDIYRTYFWNRTHIGSIDNQNLANKVFDLTVNMGPVALKLLQSAVNTSGGQCEVDGVLGPISIRQINALNADQLLAHYKRLAAQRYQRIAADNTELAGDLTAWLARLNA